VIIGAALNGDAWRVNWSRIRSWCVASIERLVAFGLSLRYARFAETGQGDRARAKAGFGAFGPNGRFGVRISPFGGKGGKVWSRRRLAAARAISECGGFVGADAGH
jgi:hypothetical protein